MIWLILMLVRLLAELHSVNDQASFRSLEEPSPPRCSAGAAVELSSTVAPLPDSVVEAQPVGGVTPLEPLDE